jgi:VanZ family protein
LVTAASVVLGVSLLGAVDEWHQSFIPGRSMSLPDWVADTAGATVGVLAIRLLPFLTPRRRPLP